MAPSARRHPGPAVLVLLKSFSGAKGRLATVLEPPARAALAREMADCVLEAARPLPVTVISNDPAVGRWAAGNGAQILPDPGGGLDAAAAAGVAHLVAAGASEVLVAHADLPRATDLVGLTGFPGVTLVADRRGEGTNVIVVPAPFSFPFAYGPGSFLRHRRACESRGWPWRAPLRPDLAWDVDLPCDLTPADLAATSRAPAPR